MRIGPTLLPPRAVTASASLRPHASTVVPVAAPARAGGHEPPGAGADVFVIRGDFSPFITQQLAAERDGTAPGEADHMRAASAYRAHGAEPGRGWLGHSLLL